MVRVSLLRCRGAASAPRWPWAAASDCRTRPSRWVPRPRAGTGRTRKQASQTMAFPWQPLRAGRAGPAHPGPAACWARAASCDPPREPVGQERVSAVLRGNNDTEQPQTAPLCSAGPNPWVCKILVPCPLFSCPFLFPSSPFVVVCSKNLCFVFHMVLS